MQEKPYVLLNGRLVPAERASVPVADRGWRFGDGVFETVRIVSGVPYQWELHLARLLRGLAALRIENPTEDWAKEIRRLLIKNGMKEGFLRIAVSRGIGSQGYKPHPPGMPPSWVVETLPTLPDPEKPYRLWLSALAKPPLHCLPVQHKLAQGVGATLALLEAADYGCEEALQLTTEGIVSETASANLFWIQGGQLFTPSLDAGCLPGTTRDAFLRLSPVPVKATRAGLGELEKAEAVFIANCRLGVWPVAEILPMAWRYDAKHTLLRTLQSLLEADRTAYARQHRKSWVKR